MPTSVDTPFTFLAFVSDAESHSTLTAYALTHELETESIQQGSIEDAIAHLQSNPSPDFLLVDVKGADDAADALDQLADVCDPSVKVLVTSTVDEFSFYQWLRDIGVHAYLLKPLTEAAIHQALHSASNLPASHELAHHGKVIAFVGARGGVGASTLALSTAAVLADGHKLNTVALDLEPQWGTLSLMLDLEPGRGLREALASPDRIDSLFLDRVLLKYNENLTILSSEEPFDTAITIHPQAAETLLEEVSQKYPVTVVDTPRELTPFSRAILSRADHIVIVAEPTLVSLRDAIRLQEFAKHTLEAKHIHVVINRTGLVTKYDVPAKDIEKSLRGKPVATIPFDAGVFGAIAGGDLPPLGKSNASPFAAGINTLVDALAIGTGKVAPSGKNKGGMMKWLKGEKR